jgi:hypothetical protein
MLNSLPATLTAAGVDAVVLDTALVCVELAPMSLGMQAMTTFSSGSTVTGRRRQTGSRSTSSCFGNFVPCLPPWVST